ncbi:MAG: FecR domain-containing protein [Myxococcaceae bacterium]|nr:FecR domain-containing protein [Myxococcaceae bacterium]
MADLASRLKAAASRLEPAWAEPELTRQAAVTSRRLVQRRRLGAAVGVSAALVLLVGALVSTRVPAGPRVEVASSGEVVVRDAPWVRTLVVDAMETKLEVVAGAARFSVEPQGQRRVVVQAGRVEVEVVGTVFVVERRAGEVRVAVDEGVVRVSFDGVVQRLVRAGEVSLFDETALAGAGSLPPSAPGAEAGVLGQRASATPLEVSEGAPPERQPAAAAERAGTSSPPADRSAVANATRAAKKLPATAPQAPWRDLAAQGAFDDAWRALQATAPRDEPEDLLRAADVARLSGHAAAAVAPLERVIERFPADARAPLAAFTLGRVLLEDLGAFAGAATAFERARALSPKGPLAADALAREVEAHARAGAKTAALARAKEYLRTWPSGPRAAAVRQWGGVLEE